MWVSRKSNNHDSIQPIYKTGFYAFACLLLVGVFLSLSLVVGKLASTAGAPLLTFLLVSMLGAGAMLCLICALKRNPMGLNQRMLEYGLVSGVLFALPNALGFFAIRHVGAGFISLSFAFPILITWLLAVVLQMEALRAWRFMGVMLGLSGGIILAVAKSNGAVEAQGWVLLVLLMPVMIACGNIYRTLRWPTAASPVFLAALMMFGGALTLIPFVLFFEAGQAVSVFNSSRVIVLLAIEVIVFTILYLFYFLLQQLAGPVYLSQIGTVAALSGMSIGVFVLGEAAPPNIGLAGVLVTIGIVLFQRSEKEHTHNTVT